MAGDAGELGAEPIFSRSDEEAMSSTVWQAFYFHGRDNAHPPARTELIEAATEDDAAKVAISHLGRCKRVDINGPRWERQQGRVILAEDGDPA